MFYNKLLYSNRGYKTNNNCIELAKDNDEDFFKHDNAPIKAMNSDIALGKSDLLIWCVKRL